MVPVWAQSQKLAEIAHIKLQYGHGNMWIEHAIITAKLEGALGALDQDGLLLRDVDLAVLGVLFLLARLRILASRGVNVLDFVDGLTFLFRGLLLGWYLGKFLTLSRVIGFFTLQLLL